MTGSSHPKFVVHCVLSQLLIGFADDGRIFDASHSGNLRTTDNGGPYNISLLTVQANEIKGEVLCL